MDSLLPLLRSRRSVRRFADKPIAPEVLAQIEEALLRSPSSRDIRPWEFVVVDDRETLAGLARCKPHGASFLRHAACAVVVCGDESASDVWIEDCSIAAILAHVTAHSLGLGSCWVQVRNRDRLIGEQTAEAYVQLLLGIPAHLRVECILGMGHPLEPKEGLPLEALQRQKIRRSGWGDATS